MRAKLRFLIDCTPERLWDCFADPANLARWVPGFEGLDVTSPEPHGQGSTYAMRVREGKRVVTYLGQNHVWDPPRRIRETITGGRFKAGQRLEADHVFTAVGSRTRFDYEQTFVTHGVARLLAPLYWFFGRLYCKRMFGKLKAVAERAE